MKGIHIAPGRGVNFLGEAVQAFVDHDFQRAGVLDLAEGVDSRKQLRMVLDVDDQRLPLPKQSERVAMPTDQRCRLTVAGLTMRRADFRLVNRHWSADFAGIRAAVTAMLDRLLHHGHVLKCGPRSWRTKTDLPPPRGGRLKQLSSRPSYLAGFAVTTFGRFSCDP